MSKGRKSRLPPLTDLGSLSLGKVACRKQTNTAPVYVRVYMAVIKQHHQKQFREERAYFGLQSIRKRSQDRNSRQETRDRS